MRHRPIFAAVFALLAFAGGVPEVRAQVEDESLVQRFQLAEAYVRGGQYDRAAATLEDLVAQSPETAVFTNRLLEVYEQLKRFDDAIILLDQRIQRQPVPAFVAEKARLQALSGDEDAARATYADAIALAPERSQTYRDVYQSLVRLRLFDDAIATLTQGRAATNDSTLFRTDLAYLYSVTAQHADAAREYVDLLSESERQLRFVQQRLGRFAEQEGALEAAIAVARRAVRAQPLYTAYRELLAWLYLENEAYGDAYDAYRALDRLQEAEGRILHTFAERAADAGAYDAALDAYAEILDRYPNATMAPIAQFGVGMMHEAWAEQIGEVARGPAGERLDALHYEAALNAYREFLDAHDAHPYIPDALRRVGRLQQDVFLDYPAAEAALGEVVALFPSADAAQQARYDLGRLAVMQGDLQEARLAFSRLEETLRLGELAERSRYELALLHFYDGGFDAARTIVSALDENTSTDVANDAISLKILLIENRGPDSLDLPLRAYAHAKLLARQRALPSALATVDSLLAAFPDHGLADETRFLRAETLRSLGRAEEARDAFGEVVLMHPASYLADRSLFRLAEVYETDLGDPAMALDTYSRLLGEYPGSLLASDARTKARALRGDGL